MRFDTPGRSAGSYVMPGIESVNATLIFCEISSGESVMMIRERGLGSDLDIFDVGALSDITRFAGAKSHVSIVGRETATRICGLQINGVGAGNM